MIPERKAVTAQILQMSGSDIAPRREESMREPSRGSAESELLTAKEVARWLKCSQSKVLRLPIPRVSLGYRSPRYFRIDVLAWLHQQQKGAPQ